jgi:hypothetical protein
MRIFLWIVSVSSLLFVLALRWNPSRSRPLELAVATVALLASKGLRIMDRDRLPNRSAPLSERQTKALLKAWDDFDLGRNRPAPPRPVARGVMWDEWLDGDHTPRLPTGQKNPRVNARG